MHKVHTNHSKQNSISRVKFIQKSHHPLPTKPCTVSVNNIFFQGQPKQNEATQNQTQLEPGRQEAEKDVARIIKTLKFFCNQSSNSKKRITIQVANDIKFRYQKLRSVQLFSASKNLEDVQSTLPIATLSQKLIPKRLFSLKNESLKQEALQLKDKKLVYYKSVDNKKQKQNAVMNGILFNLKVNFSNGLFYDHQLKSKKNLKVFIGLGNNGLLVKQIFKRRKKVLFSAQNQNVFLSWTQLKISQIHSRQSKVGMLKSECNQVQASECSILREQDELQFNKLKLQRKKGYQVSGHLSISNSGEFCMSNHLQFNNELGDKKNLFLNLRRYCQKQNIDLFRIVPLTFLLQNIQHESFQLFRKHLAFTSKNTIWIVKPGQNSNRGSGIFLISTLAQLVKQLKNKPPKSTFIVQQYLAKPLLYHQRKFDIRHFILMTSVNGKLRGYWYKDGYIRTSGRKFVAGQIDDLYVHLTNDAIQKYDQEYGQHQAGNKLSYQDFGSYLNSIKSKKDFKSILVKMRQSTTIALKAAGPFLDPFRRINNFQIFGLDFMIDQNYHPWLIEVNTNPCLQVGCSVLSRIIPGLLEQTLRISVDPLIGMSWPGAQETNKFSLIYQHQ